MKLFTFLMSFYLLFLSCMPCGDGQDCNVASATTVSAVGNHESHDHEAEACTLFCSCSCCPASAFYHSLTALQLAKNEHIPQAHIIHNISVNTEVYFNIWQPPQLAV